MHKRIRPYFIIFIAAYMLCLNMGCRTDQELNPVDGKAKMFGETKGAFRDKWWNYYERGESFAEGNLWKDAELDFKESISIRSDDQLDARTYGMHYIDYFPHRELGIALFFQQQYEASIQELETSISTTQTAKAQYYLDKARKALIEAKHLDAAPPEISIESPAPQALFNGFSVTVAGAAVDDTFVKEILVNGKHIRIDLSDKRIPFKEDMPIKSGKNTIIIEAFDLTGKKAKEELTILCDRSGPILNMNELVSIRNSDNRYALKGYCYDDSGLKEISVNGQSILTPTGSEVIIDESIALSGDQKKAIVIAQDQAGNRTRAEISPTIETSLKKLNEFNEILLASNDLIPMQFTIPFRNTDNILENITDHQEKLINLYYATNDRGSRIASENDALSNSLGTYYALIIGINEYDDWPPLKTAVNDAMAIKEILIHRYGFQKENILIRLDKEATRKALIDDFRLLASGLKENDNLLIFFAGHGQLDKISNDGYWIPVDGKIDDLCTWITNSTIKNLLSSESVRGKNIIVIADSCYSGSLLRGAASPISFASQDYQEKILTLASKKSRQIISSGGLEVVDDTGRDEHSLFTYYLLKALKENTLPFIDFENLILTKVWKPVTEKGGQRPSVGRIKTPMDEDGQFVLSLCSKPSTSEQTGMPEPLAILRNRANAKDDLASSLPDTNPPVIELRRGLEDQTVFIDQAYIEGNAADNNGIVQSLTVNGQNILKRPGTSIFFNHTVNLQEGDNYFTIECIDQVGNVTQKKINIVRKLQKVYGVGSRMTAVLLPIGFEGVQQFIEVEDVLHGDLINSNRFNMKELNRDLSNRNELNQNEKHEQDADIGLAQKMNVEVALLGKVIANERSLQISVRAVEAETSTLLLYKDVYGENPNEELLRSLCNGLVIKLCEELPLAEGCIVKISGDQVVINLGEEHHIKKGMRLIFFEEQEPVLDPGTGQVLGADVEEIGAARIVRLLPNISFTEIINKDALARLKVGQKFVMK